MRRPIVSALLLAATLAHAQTPPLVQESQPLDPRKNQKVEKMHHEDAGATIDETRYGGQVQSIRVQPRGAMPEYEIQPTDLARTRRDDQRDAFGSNGGRRVWNVFGF